MERFDNEARTGKDRIFHTISCISILFSRYGYDP